MVGMRAMNDQGAAVKALLFGAPPDPDEVRPTPGDELETMLAGLPFGLHEMDDARLVRPDWVITRPILSGICGSDAKLVLGDFSTGTSTTRWRRSPPSPTCRVTRWSPRWWRWADGHRARGRPAGRPQPVAHVRARGASTRCARRAGRVTSACAGASPRATSAPASTSA